MVVSSQGFPEVDSPNRRNSKEREYFLLCFCHFGITSLGRECMCDFAVVDYGTAFYKGCQHPVYVMCVLYLSFLLFSSCSKHREYYLLGFRSVKMCRLYKCVLHLKVEMLMMSLKKKKKQSRNWLFILAICFLHFYHYLSY